MKTLIALATVSMMAVSGASAVSFGQIDNHNIGNQDSIEAVGAGDGQISYEEFYDIVTDPDPAREDFRKKDVGGPDEKKSGGVMDAKAHERHKEIATRDEKRRMLGLFVEDNNIGPAEVNFAFEKCGAGP